jgi:CheY-like chemotaxis protein
MKCGQILYSGMLIASINAGKRLKMQKRILIVDDYHLNRLGLSRALKVLCGFQGEVNTVANGREALWKVNNCFYNICFVDLTLPDINGIDIMRGIIHISPETDLVLMTACTLHNDVKIAIEEYSSLLIFKPFDMLEIKQFLKRAFDKDRDFYKKRVGSEEVLTKGKRHLKRRPLMKAIDYSINNPEAMMLQGEVMDISYEGMGMRAYFPLEHGHVIAFHDGIAHEKGVVKWSDSRDDNNMVGIKFI